MGIVRAIGTTAIAVLTAILVFFGINALRAPRESSPPPSEISALSTSTPPEEERAGVEKAVVPPRTPVSAKTRIPPPPREKIQLPEKIATTSTPQPSKPVLPPLNETAVLGAVVKIECPAKDGGEFIGSGFAFRDEIVVTAAHVVMDAASTTCEVIFPRDRRPVHYLKGKLREERAAIKRRHDEEGIDVAFLSLVPLASYPEARAIFSAYPAIPYPLCRDPVMLGDTLLHFGYPANYADQNYLSRLEGEAVSYADIAGTKEVLSEDQTYTYQTPLFSYTSDETRFHPYMVSRVASFYGDSGGLALNASKQCVLGPHRGGTIGGAAGENFSVFTLLNWETVRLLLE